MRDFGLSLALFGMILTATGVDRLVLRGPDGVLLCSTYSINKFKGASGGAGRNRAANLPGNNEPGNNRPDQQPGSLCPHGVLCNFRRTTPDA